MMSMDHIPRSGGIIFDSVGSTTPSAFNDILIDGNILTDVDAYGIYIGSIVSCATEWAIYGHGYLNHTGHGRRPPK